MIDRVGNGTGYDYSPVNEKKINNGAVSTGEKFQLDYGKEGAIYEPSREGLKKQQEEKKLSSQLQDLAQGEEAGVHLTLSGTDHNQEKETSEKEESSISVIIQRVTSIVNKAIEFLKALWSRIWNDAPEKEVSEDQAIDETLEINNEDTATLLETMEATEETESEKISKPLTQFEKAKAEAEAFLSSAEGKKVARNSDLLTYYDRHGVTVTVNPSDRQRILYGDKNQMGV